MINGWFITGKILIITTKLKYFSYETYVLKEIPDDSGDEDPEEHENEIEKESVVSSETYDSE